MQNDLRISDSYYMRPRNLAMLSKPKVFTRFLTCKHRSNALVGFFKTLLNKKSQKTKISTKSFCVPRILFLIMLLIVGAETLEGYN